MPGGSLEGRTPIVAGSSSGIGKATALHMARAMALEFDPQGVRVNCILPGTIDISLYGRKGSAADRENWEPRASSHQVLGRMGSPDEIAAAICFLASEDASFVNGPTLVADGGLPCTLGDGLHEDN